MKPQRLTVTHSLVLHYGMYNKMQVRFLEIFSERVGEIRSIWKLWARTDARDLVAF